MDTHLKHTISQKRYLSAAQVFHWATQEQFTLWFTGSAKRSKRTEAILPRLVKKGSLIAIKHGKKLAYSCPRRVRNPRVLTEVDHGIGCTEGLIRFYWSDMSAEIIPERMFYGCGLWPEWGLRYDNGKMILFEFCTADNFRRTNVMNSKLFAYRMNLEAINTRFNRDSIIIFVCDVPKHNIDLLVASGKAAGLPVFFTDYATFTQVPIGEQLAAPIYKWGEDGLSYPLVKNAQSTHS